MGKIDLHIHTTFSDGCLSPKEVIDEALKNNVKIIAITDHDTIDAYDENLYLYAKQNNIRIINGVEISTKAEKCGIHVLGYNFDINNVKLKETIASLKRARHDYLYNVSLKLNDLGYILNTDKLSEIESVTKAHIALDVINNPINRKLLEDNFGSIPSKGEFIETLMNEGCSAYVEKSSITPKKASELIKSAGGKVVLAHPVAYFYEDNLSDEEIIDIAVCMEADGMESNYLYVNSNNNKINDIYKWNRLADENNLFKTIGSDFHAIDGLRQEIGLDSKEVELTDKEILELINYIEKNSN